MSTNDKANQPKLPVQQLPFWRQLRWTLITLFVLLAAIPVIIAVSFILNRQVVQTEEQVLAQLESVAKLKQDQITRWLNDVEASVNVFLSDSDRGDRFTVFTDASLLEGAVLDLGEQEQLNTLLQQAVAAEPNINAFLLYNMDGEVIAASNPDDIRKLVTRQPYFESSLTGGEHFVQTPYYQIGNNDPVMFITHPIFNEQGDQVAGALAARLNVGVLGQIMLELAGLGDTGETYLVSPDFNYLVTSSRFEDDGYLRQRAYHSQGIDNALARETGSGIYEDYRSVPVFGVYHWLPKLRVALLAEIDESEALASANQLRNLALLFTGAIILVAVLAGFIGAARVAIPITNLTQVATSIAAGNLNQRAKIKEVNEIGLLAASFNDMTGQLQTFIESLEDRITERTQRLKIVAILSERLSAILDFDQLLQEMVNQVKDSFNYYHAHVYIIDEERQNLIMTAGAGEAGAEMKASGHRISYNAPTSLVARAARTGEIISVDNVREAPDWLPNPLLPDTYSEMAVPIILDEQVVGVLDVQEDEIVGLDESDANLLRSLANQVAVAIRNARLFEQVETALTEARAAQEQYVQQAWEEIRVAGQSAEYQHQRPGSPPLNDALVAQFEQQAMQQSQPVIVAVNAKNIEPESDASDEVEEQPATSIQSPPSKTHTEPRRERGERQSLSIKNAVLAPIKLQDQTIGAIQLHETDVSRQRHWDEQELALIAAVAEQVAQSAENLRLFDETRQKVAQEQMVREITEKMRAAPTMEALLKTTTEELGQRLATTHAKLELGLEANPEQSNGTGEQEGSIRR